MTVTPQRPGCVPSQCQPQCQPSLAYLSPTPRRRVPRDPRPSCEERSCSRSRRRDNRPRCGAAPFGTRSAGALPALQVNRTRTCMSYSSHASVTHLRLMRIDRVFTNFASVNRGKLKQDNAPAIILQGRELSLRH